MLYESTNRRKGKVLLPEYSYLFALSGEGRVDFLILSVDCLILDFVVWHDEQLGGQLGLLRLDLP